MDNIDLKKLLSVLSKMDKKDIEKGISEAKQILNQNSSEEILNNLKKEKD